VPKTTRTNARNRIVAGISAVFVIHIGVVAAIDGNPDTAPDVDAVEGAVEDLADAVGGGGEESGEAVREAAETEETQP
jgi:hypothetical protein